MDLKAIWDKSKVFMHTLLIVVFVANSLVATAVVVEWADLPDLGDRVVGGVLFAYALLYFVMHIYKGLNSKEGE